MVDTLTQDQVDTILARIDAAFPTQNLRLAAALEALADIIQGNIDIVRQRWLSTQ